MRYIILPSPGRYRLLFPQRIPKFCKNIDQEFTVSCKGACMCGSYCHIPTAETYSNKTTAELYWRTFIIPFCTLRLRLGRMMDLLIKSLLAAKAANDLNYHANLK